MKERIREIRHSGKLVLFFDFTKLMTDDFIRLLALSEARITKGLDQLLLFDVTGASVFGEAMERSKLFAKAIVPHRRRSAIMGINGPKKILLNALLAFTGSGASVKACASMEEALEWLTR